MSDHKNNHPEIPEIHIRRKPDAPSNSPVWCGEIGVASITEAWGYYGPGGPGHPDVCRTCLAAQQRRTR